MEEIWKPIKDYEGLYEVSNFGNIRSLDRFVNGRVGNKQFIKGQKISKTKDKYGYYKVSLSKKGKNHFFRICRLVAIHFINNPNNYPIVNHKDECKSNDYYKNLEWCTYEYNNTYNNIHIRRGNLNRNNRISKKVYQYSLDGVFIKQWPSLSECGRQGYNIGSISRCMSGKQNYHYGYIWDSEFIALANV